MGKKSRSKQTASASSAAVASAASAAAGAAPVGVGSPGASALNLLGPDSDISARLGELLDSIHCRSVLQRLQAGGYSEHVAQRACLEVHQAKREVTYESCVKWIRQHDITKIDRPVQPLELLRYLTELVASLVQRLPRAEPAPLPRQLAAEPRGAGSVLAGGGGGSAAALVAQVPSLSLEAEVQCVGGSRRSAVVLEELDYDTLCQLVADEQAQDIEALMLELGAAEEHSAEVVAAAAAPAAVAVSAPTADGGSAKLHSSSDAASSGCSRSAAHARGAAEQPTSAACATQERAGSGSDSSNGGSGFTERVAQQVLGLQQQMSKALASLRRSSSSCSSGSTRAAGTASGAADTDATVAAGMVSAEQDAYAEPPLAGHSGRPGQQLSKEPLGALCDTLGPGVEACTAEEQKQRSTGANNATPLLDPTTLSHQPATSTAASLAAAAASAAVAGSDALALAAELASLRAHRQWADRHIARLIRRVGDAERPARQEAARLVREVEALRVEKELTMSKLGDLERSISRIKERSYLEAQQRRELERQAAETAAELKAASLREQEATAEVASLQKQLAQERRRREAAEQRCKKSAAEAAEAAAATAAAAAERELADLRQQLCRAREVAEQRRLAAEHADAAAAEAQVQALAAARAECRALAAERAFLATALEEAQQRAQRAETAQHSVEQRCAALHAELEAAKQRAEGAEAAAAGLRQQLAAARAEAAAADARAAAASAAAEAAQQRAAFPRASVGLALASPDPLTLLPAPAAATEAPAALTIPPSLLGSHLGAWSAGLGANGSGSVGHCSSSGPSGLFGSNGWLDGSLSAAMVGGPHTSALRPLPHGANPGLGGSSGAPGSPLSYPGSGSMTPPHSGHSSSISNSPGTLPGSLALAGGGSGVGQAASAGAGPGAGGFLFAGCDTGSSADSLLGGSAQQVLLPSPAGIWSPPGPGGFGGLPLFAAQQH